MQLIPQVLLISFLSSPSSKFPIPHEVGISTRVCAALDGKSLHKTELGQVSVPAERDGHGEGEPWVDRTSDLTLQDRSCHRFSGTAFITRIIPAVLFMPSRTVVSQALASTLYFSQSV